MTPYLESVGCEFEYRTFCFWKERPSLISLILNTKSEKHDCFVGDIFPAEQALIFQI